MSEVLIATWRQKAAEQLACADSTRLIARGKEVVYRECADQLAKEFKAGAEPVGMGDCMGDCAAWIFEWAPPKHEQWAAGLSFKDPRIAGPMRYRNVHPLYAALPVEDVTAEELLEDILIHVGMGLELDDLMARADPVVQAFQDRRARAGAANE